jgi:hypothetical protein
MPSRVDAHRHLAGALRRDSEWDGRTIIADARVVDPVSRFAVYECHRSILDDLSSALRSPGGRVTGR